MIRVLFRSGGLLLTTIIFLMSLYNVSSEVSEDINDFSTSYSSFVDNSDNYRYDVETFFAYLGAYSGYSMEESFVFNEAYCYSVSDTSYTTKLVSKIERLVLHENEGDQYYYRNRFFNFYAVDDLEYTPYLKTDNALINDEINAILQDPIFSLDEYWDQSDSYFIIEFSDMSSDDQEYIKDNIHFYLPDIEISSSGAITYNLTFEGDKLTKINVRYGELISELTSFNQTFTISEDTYLNISELLADSLDISNLSSLEGSNLPSIGIDEDCDFEEGFRSEVGQLCFFEITSDGEYIFNTTDDNTDIGPFWYLYDLDFNRLDYRLDNNFMESFFNSDQMSIYLEAGIYMLYLRPMSINMNEATIKFSSADPTDDYSNCYTPTTEIITQDTTVQFVTDYQYDRDVFRVEGNCDYVVVSTNTDFAVSIKANADFELDYAYSTYFIEMPEGGVLDLYFSSKYTGEHEADIKLISYTDVAQDFAETDLLDFYNMDSYQALYGFIALANQGGVARYQFNVSEDTLAYLRTGNAMGRIFDSELNEMSYTGYGVYSLSEGTYYLELYNFQKIFTTFMIFPEPAGEEVRELDAESIQHRIIGFVEDNTDEDIYQFNLAVDSNITFDNIDAVEVLIYGVDNPNVYVFDTRSKVTHLLPSGIYNMTLPCSYYQFAPNTYNFVMNIEPFIPEPDEVFSYSNIVIGDEVTTYQYYVSFDYYGDVEKIALDLPAGAKVNFTFSSYIFSSIYSYPDLAGTLGSYLIDYSSYSTDYQGSYLYFGNAGTMVVTISDLTQSNLNYTPNGELLIEIHVKEGQ